MCKEPCSSYTAALKLHCRRLAARFHTLRSCFEANLQLLQATCTFRQSQPCNYGSEYNMVYGIWKKWARQLKESARVRCKVKGGTIEGPRGGYVPKLGRLHQRPRCTNQKRVNTINTRHRFSCEQNCTLQQDCCATPQMETSPTLPHFQTVGSWRWCDEQTLQ